MSNPPGNMSEPKPKLWVAIDCVAIENLNKEDEKRMGLGSQDPNETKFDNAGDLYRACQKEFGRCTGFVYVGDPYKHEGKKIGWIFIKRAPNDEPGVQETWVSVFSTPPKLRSEWVGGEYAEIG